MKSLQKTCTPKIFHSCRVSPNKTFGGLSERQRADLAGRMDR
jgi:hypothetical protein